ncbi:glycosyltransferase [Janibacter sp. LM]|uniref:glycosyltransferase n=1 Tax=Janibacter sp. LM TaxID=3144845 RepID=UPI0031F64DF9
MSRSTNPAALTDRLRRAARAAVGELRPSTPAAPAAPVAPATAGPAPQEQPTAQPELASPPSPTTTAPHSPVPALDLTVAVAAGPHLGGLLAPEWTQRDLDRRSWREALTRADLLVLEGRGGSVPGWGDGSALGELLTNAKGADLPVVLWVTDDTAPGAWAQDVTVVGASSQAAIDAISASGREAQRWAPAAQPRTVGDDREDPTTGRRSGALAVVDGLSRLADDSSLRLVEEALTPMPRSQTRLVRRPGKSAVVTLPAGLAERVGDAVTASDASVLLDLSATSPDAAWTTVAAAAARTPVVGTEAHADLPAEVDALVPRVTDSRSLRSELVARVNQEELVAREGLRLQRAVLAGHTGAHRARELATAAGLEVPAITPATISAVVPTNRTHELDNVFANLGRQDHPAVELVLVLHGLDTDDADLRRRATEAGVTDLQIVHADASLTLGACMNLGVDAAGGRYIAKMDDDNIYGPRYLSDLLGAFAHTDAGIVGKWAHYVWLRSTGAVVLRYPDSEHRYERRIQGGSMLFAGDVVREVRFSDIPRAVDSDILDRSMAQGVRVWSGDRYNYVSVRGDDRLSHTWTVTDSTFLTATGRLLFYGDPTTHVSL